MNSVNKSVIFIILSVFFIFVLLCEHFWRNGDARGCNLRR
jgi:hypothetical protein